MTDKCSAVLYFFCLFSFYIPNDTIIFTNDLLLFTLVIAPIGFTWMPRLGGRLCCPPSSRTPGSYLCLAHADFDCVDSLLYYGIGKSGTGWKNRLDVTQIRRERQRPVDLAGFFSTVYTK